MTDMPSKPKTNRATRTLLFTQILKAITQYINATIVLRGQSLTPQALAASFTAALQADTDLDAAEAVVKDKRLARKAAYAPAVALLAPLHQHLLAEFGPTSPVVTAFGFPAPNPAEKTAEVKAAAAQKARATRAAKKAAKAPPPKPQA
jgi:hypothetical protein